MVDLRAGGGGVDERNGNSRILTEMAIQFSSKVQKAKTFGNFNGCYGRQWCKYVKGDESGKTLPTPEEVLISLYYWLCCQLERGLRALKVKEQKIALKQRYKEFKK